MRRVLLPPSVKMVPNCHFDRHPLVNAGARAASAALEKAADDLRHLRLLI